VKATRSRGNSQQCLDRAPARSILLQWVEVRRTEVRPNGRGRRGDARTRGRQLADPEFLSQQDGRN